MFIFPRRACHSSVENDLVLTCVRTLTSLQFHLLAGCDGFEATDDMADAIEQYITDTIEKYHRGQPY